MSSKLPMFFALLALLYAAPLHAQDDAPDAPDADHELVGTWMGLSMDGEELEEDEFVITFDADGTGHFVEDHDDFERFTYTYDAEAEHCVLFFDGDEDNAFPMDVTFDGDTVTLAPENDDTVVARRVVVEDGDDAEDPPDAPQPAEGESPLVGEWEGVSRNGEPVPEGDSVTLTFNADGSGEVVEGGPDDTDPFTWSYDATAEVCTIVDDGHRMKFMVAFEDDTMTFESEDGDMFMVMRRVAVEEDGDAEGGDDADDDTDVADEAADAADDMDRADVEHPEGVLGTWYAQRMRGEWVPADEEFRLEFREDGTLRVFENGDEESELVAFSVVEDRRMIQFFEDDGELEVEMAYALFDDVMVLDVVVPDEFREDFGLEEDDQIQMVFSRLPEGNEEHQQMRAVESTGHPVNGDSPRKRARRMQSATQLRGIHQGIVTYSFSNRGFYPDDMGVLLPGDFLTAEYLLAPWSDVEVPDDIREWSDDDKAAWSIANTSYAFALGGLKEAADAELVALFELPLFESTETITVCFDDNHVEVMDYDGADALIEEQTGRNLMGWMEDLGREQVAVEDAGDAGGDAAHNHADGAEHPAEDGGHFHADGTYHEGAADAPAGADDHDYAHDQDDYDHD